MYSVVRSGNDAWMCLAGEDCSFDLRALLKGWHASVKYCPDVSDDYVPERLFNVERALATPNTLRSMGAFPSSTFDIFLTKIYPSPRYRVCLQRLGVGVRKLCRG